MELTANDIRNYEFPSQMRGYDKEEVNSLLEEAAAALENAKQESLKLSKEVESLSIQFTSLKQFEDTIKGAAIDARRNADMTMANARTEADQLIAKAKAEAESILGSRSDEVSKIESQIAKLEHTKKSYLTKVRDMIQSHMAMIDEILEEIPETTKQAKKPVEQPKIAQAKTEQPKSAKSQSDDSITVLDSNEVDVRKRETVATQPAKSQTIITEEAHAADPAIAKMVAKTDVSDAEVASTMNQLQANAPKPAPDTTATAPNIPEAVTTDKLATDVPPEFIPSKPVAKTDASVTETAKPAAKPPEDIAAALDDVVKSFEEKMDEASGS